MTSGRTPTRLMTWGAALLVAACIAMLVATQLYFAYDVDKDARRQSEMIVDMAISNHAKVLQNELLPQTYWDDAVINLDNRLDPAWAKMMISDYFVGARGYDFAAVFDRSNRLVLLRTRAKAVPTEIRDDLVKVSAPALGEVRRVERQRGPLPLVQPDGMSIKRISSWGLATIGGQPYLLAAGLVQPDQKAQPLTRRSAIAMIGMVLDQPAIDAIAAEHHIKGMRFVSPSGRPGTDLATIELVGHSGARDEISA